MVASHPAALGRTDDMRPSRFRLKAGPSLRGAAIEGRANLGIMTFAIIGRLSDGAALDAIQDPALPC
jgi:hypothetical protein